MCTCIVFECVYVCVCVISGEKNILDGNILVFQMLSQSDRIWVNTFPFYSPILSKL